MHIKDRVDKEIVDIVERLNLYASLKRLFRAEITFKIDGSKVRGFDINQSIKVFYPKNENENESKDDLTKSKSADMKEDSQNG